MLRAWGPPALVAPPVAAPGGASTSTSTTQAAGPVCCSNCLRRRSVVGLSQRAPRCRGAFSAPSFGCSAFGAVWHRSTCISLLLASAGRWARATGDAAPPPPPIAARPPALQTRAAGLACVTCLPRPAGGGMWCATSFQAGAAAPGTHGTRAPDAPPEQEQRCARHQQHQQGTAAG
jgi:hypothetical protein